MEQSIESLRKKIKREPVDHDSRASDRSEKSMVSDEGINHNEQEVLKYITGFDMKLSVVILKIRLNSLMFKYNYKSEITREFIRTLGSSIEEEYNTYKSHIKVDNLDSPLLEKINMSIFFQNANYKSYLEQNYFKDFSHQNFKHLISGLWKAEPLTKIIEKMAQHELEAIAIENDSVILKEKASKFYTSNLINLHKIKDLENDLKHCKYIMQYQSNKINDLQTENSSLDLSHFKKKKSKEDLLTKIKNESLE